MRRTVLIALGVVLTVTSAAIGLRAHGHAYGDPRVRTVATASGRAAPAAHPQPLLAVIGASFSAVPGQAHRATPGPR